MPNRLDPPHQRIPDAFGPDLTLHVLETVRTVGLERDEPRRRLLEEPDVEVAAPLDHRPGMSLERLRRTLQNLDRRHSEPP